jgi:hypothetical protein
MVERTMIQKARKDFAKSWLAPTLNLLQPATVISILLFISALLFQSWQLALAEGRAALSFATSTAATILVAALIGLVFACLAHAVRYHHSPFSAPLLGVIRYLVRGAPPKYVEEDEKDKRESTRHLPALIERTSDADQLNDLAPVLRACMIEARRIAGGAAKHPLQLHAHIEAMLKILRSGSSPTSKLVVAAITTDHFFIERSRLITGESTEEERDFIIASWKLLELFEELYLQAVAVKAAYRSDYLGAYAIWFSHGLQCILSKEINSLHDRPTFTAGELGTGAQLTILIRLCSWLIRLDDKLHEGSEAGILIGHMRYVVEQELQLGPSSLQLEKRDLVSLFHCVYFARRSNKGIKWSDELLCNIVKVHGLDTLSAFANASSLDGAEDGEVALKLLGLLMTQIIHTRSMHISQGLVLTQWVRYLIRWGHAVFDSAEAEDDAFKFELTVGEDSMMELIGLALHLLSRLVDQEDGQKLSALADRSVLSQFFTQNKRRFGTVVGNERAERIVESCQHCSELLSGGYLLNLRLNLLAVF